MHRPRMGLAETILSAFALSGKQQEPKYRRGFYGQSRPQGVWRAHWVDNKPGWTGADIREMNARNGVGSSKRRR